MHLCITAWAGSVWHCLLGYQTDCTAASKPTLLQINSKVSVGPDRIYSIDQDKTSGLMETDEKDLPGQAWQDSRNKAKAAEEAAKEAEEAQAAKWSLEDDFEEDEGGAPGPSRPSRKALEEGSDEIDPLEAFMNQNAETLVPPSRPKTEADEGQANGAGDPADEVEIDPLDAYMDAQVLPTLPPPRPPTPPKPPSPCALIPCNCTLFFYHRP